MRAFSTEVWSASKERRISYRRMTPRVCLLSSCVFVLASCGANKQVHRTDATTTSTTLTAETTTSTTLTTQAACGVLVGPGSNVIRETAPCSFATKVGVVMHVALSNTLHWGDPVSSNSAVVRVLGVGQQASDGLDFGMRAVGRGTATVTDAASSTCPPGSICSTSLIGWNVTITVG